jgi:hypothetical protein
MTEQQLEMMDDYLSNRLSADEKTAFEQQVQADPQLAQELDLQKNLVDGIRQARALELKSILNNIPVSPVSGGSSMLMKVGTWAVVAGLVVTGIYFYSTRNEESTTSELNTISEQKPEVKPEVAEVQETESESTTAEKKESSPTVTKAEEKVKKSQPEAEPTPAKPIDVYVPADEEIDEKTRQYEREQLENIKKAFVTSSIVVETDTMSKKYNFHYVFKNSKLILYGAFEKNLYEILEFIGEEKRTVVLFYKSNYYLLDIDKTQPTKLTPIRDKKLLKMLQATRSK